jgi:hypothetical protein
MNFFLSYKTADFSCFISGWAVLRIAVSTDHVAYRCELSLSEVWIALRKLLYHFLIACRSSFWSDTGVVSWNRLLDLPMHSTTFIVIYFTSLQLIQCRLNVQEPKLSSKLPSWFILFVFRCFSLGLPGKVAQQGMPGRFRRLIWCRIGF